MRRVLSSIAAASRLRGLKDVTSAVQHQRLPTTTTTTTTLVHRRQQRQVGASAAGAGGSSAGDHPVPMEEGSKRGVEDDAGDDGDHHLADCGGPLLLPAALKVPDDLANLLSAEDGKDFVAGVHRLSARSRGIIELPETLDHALRVAVRDTGHTHRQVKVKGRSLLDALKSISRGMPTPDADEAAVKEWLKATKKNQNGLEEAGAGTATLGEGVEWGVRLPVRKQRRILQGMREDAAAAMAAATGGGVGPGGVVRRGKGVGATKKKPPAPSESATNYGPLEAAAYAITRLPMTFGAQQRVFQELKVRSPGFDPRTLLDFGAGPAPSLWAARCVFGEHFGAMDEAAVWGRGGGRAGTFNTTTTLVDASPSMMAFTRRVAKIVYDARDLEDLGTEMGFLSKPSGRPLPDPNPWGDTGPVRTVASLRSLSPKAFFDLVVAAYSLGELAVGTRHEQQQQILRGGSLSGGGRGAGGASGLEGSGEHKTGGQKRVEDTVRTLWSRVAPGGALVLIEPGTPRGSELIRKARALVLEAERTVAEKNLAGKENAANAVAEVHVVAPCQHDRTCPMDGLNSWCHFSQRVKRSEMHRQMLPRGRGPQHQDERFSYVVIRRLSREGAAAELAERAARFAAGDWGHSDEEDEVGDLEGGEIGDDDEENMDEEEREERRLIRMSIRGSGVDAIGVAGELREEASAEDRRMMTSTSARGEEQEQMEDDDEHEEDEEDELDEDEDEDEHTSETLADAVAAASSYGWGRMVRPPLKKSGHVIIDLCTAEGSLTRHIVAKSNAWEGGVGKSGYKAARKSKWGDLWPYGDPRRLNELDEDEGKLEEFFKEFDGEDVVEFKSSPVEQQKEQRKTPVGVASAKKPFMSKRPKIVEQYVDMEQSGPNMNDEEK